MYKENIIISFPDSENWVKWYGEKVVLNGETRGKNVNGTDTILTVLSVKIKV